jgi:hypothetical protein
MVTAGERGIGSTRRFRDVLAETVDYTGQLIRVQKTLADQLLASTNPVFKAIDSWGRYQDTLGDADASAFDITESTLEMMAAFGALDSNQIETAMGTVAEIMGITATAARDLFEQAGLLDGLEISTKFNVDWVYRQVGEPGFIPDSSSAGGRSTIDPFRRGAVAGARQHGGPVTAGRLYRVNEDRLEYFRPAQGGTVLPIAPAGAATVGQGSTFHFSPTINNPTTSNLRRDLQTGLLLAQVSNLVEAH